MPDLLPLCQSCGSHFREEVRGSLTRRLATNEVICIFCETVCKTRRFAFETTEQSQTLEIKKAIAQAANIMMVQLIPEDD